MYHTFFCLGLFTAPLCWLAIPRLHALYLPFTRPAHTRHISVIPVVVQPRNFKTHCVLSRPSWPSTFFAVGWTVLLRTASSNVQDLLQLSTSLGNWPCQSKGINKALQFYLRLRAYFTYLNLWKGLTGSIF